MLHAADRTFILHLFLADDKSGHTEEEEEEDEEEEILFCRLIAADVLQRTDGAAAADVCYV